MAASAPQAGSLRCSSPGHRSYHLYFLPCPRLWSRVSLALRPPPSTHPVLTFSSGPADSPQEGNREGQRPVLHAGQPGMPGPGANVRLSVE